MEEGKKQFKEEQISLMTQLESRENDQITAHATDQEESAVKQQSELTEEDLAKLQYQEKQQEELEDVHLNVLLVEDDYYDRINAKNIIDENYHNIDIYTTGTVQGALKELVEHDMDLLLLDIRLPDGTAFDLVRTIRTISQYRFVHIVFITGEDYDPLKTFSTYHCYAFISKPYFKETLTGQLTPILEALKKEKLEGRAQVRHKVRIFNTTAGELILPVDDILYIEMQLRNMIIHTETKIYTVKRMSIKAFLEYIDDPDFFRCHESCVVNMRKVVMIGATGHRDSIAVFDNGDKGCTVSQRRCHEMKELLDKEALRRDSRRDR